MIFFEVIVLDETDPSLGSVRVKINEYFHAWSDFVFVSPIVIFNFFPQINHFYYFTSLHGLQNVVNRYCAHLRDIELKTGRRIPYLRFPHVLFLTNQTDYLNRTENNNNSNQTVHYNHLVFLHEAVMISLEIVQ